MTFPENIQEYDSFSIGQRIQDIRLQKGIKALDMAVGRRIEGDAEGKLFFHAVEMSLHCLGDGCTIRPIIRRFAGYH